MPTLNEDLLASIHRRWPNYETKSVYAVSTIVDPRYKDCGFEDTSASDYAKSLVLKEMMLNVDRQVQLQREDEQCIPGQSISKSSKYKVLCLTHKSLRLVTHLISAPFSHSHLIVLLALHLLSHVIALLSLLV